MSSKIEFVWEIFLLLTHTSFDIEFKSKVLCYSLLTSVEVSPAWYHISSTKYATFFKASGAFWGNNIKPMACVQKGTENWQLTFKMQLTFIIYKNTTYYYCNIIIILSQQSWTNPLTFRFKHIQSLRISAFVTLYSFNFMSNTFVNNSFLTLVSMPSTLISGVQLCKVPLAWTVTLWGFLKDQLLTRQLGPSWSSRLAIPAATIWSPGWLIIFFIFCWMVNCNIFTK